MYLNSSEKCIEVLYREDCTPIIYQGLLFMLSVHSNGRFHRIPSLSKQSSPMSAFRRDLWKYRSKLAITSEGLTREKLF